MKGTISKKRPTNHVTTPPVFLHPHNICFCHFPCGTPGKPRSLHSSLLVHLSHLQGCRALCTPPLRRCACSFPASAAEWQTSQTTWPPTRTAATPQRPGASGQRHVGLPCLQARGIHLVAQMAAVGQHAACPMHSGAICQLAKPGSPAMVHALMHTYSTGSPLLRRLLAARDFSLLLGPLYGVHASSRTNKYPMLLPVQPTRKQGRSWRRWRPWRTRQTRQALLGQQQAGSAAVVLGAAPARDGRRRAGERAAAGRGRTRTGVWRAREQGLGAWWWRPWYS